MADNLSSLRPILTVEGATAGDEAVEAFQPRPGLVAGMRQGDVLAAPIGVDFLARMGMARDVFRLPQSACTSGTCTPALTSEGMMPGDVIAAPFLGVSAGARLSREVFRSAAFSVASRPALARHPHIDIAIPSVQELLQASIELKPWRAATDLNLQLEESGADNTKPELFETDVCCRYCDSSGVVVKEKSVRCQIPAYGVHEGCCEPELDGAKLCDSQDRKCSEDVEDKCDCNDSDKEIYEKSLNPHLGPCPPGGNVPPLEDQCGNKITITCEGDRWVVKFNGKRIAECCYEPAVNVGKVYYTMHNGKICKIIGVFWSTSLANLYEEGDSIRLGCIPKNNKYFSTMFFYYVPVDKLYRYCFEFDANTASDTSCAVTDSMLTPLRIDPGIVRIGNTGESCCDPRGDN